MNKVFVLLFTMFLLISIGDTVGSETGEAEWTVMIYMGGGAHEDICEQVEGDLAQIASGAPGSKVNVIVLSDRSGVDDSKLWYHHGDGLTEMDLSLVNESWGQEVDMADGESLGDFVRWSVARYPAKRYMLYIWGHGDGWRGMPMETDGDLYLYEIDRALDGVKLDVIGFDSCSMGTLEMYHQLRDRTDIIIASPGDIPLHGLPYHAVLDRMGDEPGMCSEEVSVMIIREFNSWAVNNTPLSTGLLALRTADFPVNEINHYGDTLRASLPYYRTALQEARNETRADGSDIFHFTMNVASEIDCGRLARAGFELREALNRSIVYGMGTHSSHVGISLHLDDTYLDEYEQLSFSQEVWGGWLRSLEDQRAFDEPDVDLDVGLDNGVMNMSFHHHLNNGMTEVDIYDDSGVFLEYTFDDPSYQFSLEVPPGNYRVDAYLYLDGSLHYHGHNELYHERYLLITGRVEYRDGIQLEIVNTRTGDVINQTLDHGDYEFTLHQPGFCVPGDTLNFTYYHGDSVETMSIQSPNEDRLEVDFAVEKDSHLITVLAFALMTAMIGGIVYLVKHHAQGK